MNQIQLEQIKENIRTINPNFTDELLDLLYEYIITRYTQTFKETGDLKEFFNKLCNPL